MFKFIKFLIILVVVFLAVGFLSYQNGINKPAGAEGEEIPFKITAGESVKQITDNLAVSELIGSKLIFEIYVWQTGQQANFQAGEYMLNPNYSIKEIVNILVAGKVLSDERDIKIIEGWRIDEIGAYLEDNNIVQAQVFTTLANKEIGNWKSARPAGGLEISDFDFLEDAPDTASLEGYLFPDTYKIFKDADAGMIIVKMLDNFNNKLTPELREELAAHGRSIHEIITLASIVEREVSASEDRKIVAGIFEKRLAAGMPLQADSTVNYITGKKTPAITLADRDIDSPYNTYKYPGLPPGPICNPGLDAIIAAVNPQTSNYLYFLNRQDTGKTIFSKTYEEHLRNKAKFLK